MFTRRKGKLLPKGIKPQVHCWARQLKPGDPPNSIYSSRSNSRFVLIYLTSCRTYAEYYLHSPGSLFGYDYSEQLVVKRLNEWVVTYNGEMFQNEHFKVVHGLKMWTGIES